MPSCTALVFILVAVSSIISAPPKSKVTFENVYRFLISLGENLHELSKTAPQDGNDDLQIDQLAGMESSYKTSSPEGKRFLGKREVASAIAHLLQYESWRDVLVHWPMIEEYCDWKRTGQHPDLIDVRDEEMAKSQKLAKHHRQKPKELCDKIVVFACSFLIPEQDPIFSPALANAFLAEAGAMLNKGARRTSKVITNALPKMSYAKAIFNWKAIVDACQNVYRNANLANRDVKHLQATCIALYVPAIPVTEHHGQ